MRLLAITRTRWISETAVATFDVTRNRHSSTQALASFGDRKRLPPSSRQCHVVDRFRSDGIFLPGAAQWRRWKEEIHLPSFRRVAGAVSGI